MNIIKLNILPNSPLYCLSSLQNSFTRICLPILSILFFKTSISILDKLIIIRMFLNSLLKPINNNHEPKKISTSNKLANIFKNLSKPCTDKNSATIKALTSNITKNYYVNYKPFYFSRLYSYTYI